MQAQTNNVTAVKAMFAGSGFFAAISWLPTIQIVMSIGASAVAIVLGTLGIITWIENRKKRKQ